MRRRRGEPQHRRAQAGRKIDGKDGLVANFFVYYEIDDNLSKHCLTLEDYNGDDEGSWVLLEAEPAEPAPP